MHRFGARLKHPLAMLIQSMPLPIQKPQLGGAKRFFKHREMLNKSASRMKHKAHGAQEPEHMGYM